MWNIFEKKAFETPSEEPELSKSEQVELGAERGVQVEPGIKDQLQVDKNIDEIFEDPEVRSRMSIVYELPESAGRELRPEHRLAFVIPPEFRGRIVRDVILMHRKDSKYAVDIGANNYDPNGAYSRVELHDLTSEEWKKWRDPAGYQADKFAEPRSASDPEHEVLHDWVATVGEVKPDAVRVTNVGKHAKYSTSSIHGVEVVFHPELKNVRYQEKVYCQGTEFIDIENGKMLPSYGGGEHSNGEYIGAIALNQHGHAIYELGTDPGPEATIENGRLIVNLDPRQTLAQVEISIGDTERLDQKTRLGWAKLWVGVRRSGSSSIEWFIKNANIPPQGVLAGAPLIEKSSIKDGDQLVIESRNDTAYVMGYRIGYEKAENKE